MSTSPSATAGAVVPAARAVALDVDRPLDTRGVFAEELQIAGDLARIAGRLGGVVGKLDRRAAIGLGDLADQRDRRQPTRLDRRAVLEVVGQVGAPAERSSAPCRGNAGRSPRWCRRRAHRRRSEASSAGPCRVRATSAGSARRRRSAARCRAESRSSRRPNRERRARRPRCRRRREGRSEGCRRSNAASPAAPYRASATALRRCRRAPPPPSAAHARWCQSLRGRCPWREARCWCR